MDCERVRARLVALFDGELGGPEAVAIQDHLAACRECAAEWTALERLRGLARDHLRTKAPAGLEAEILAAAATEPAGGRSQAEPAPHRLEPDRGDLGILQRLLLALRQPRVALVGGALLVVIVLGLRVLREEPEVSPVPGATSPAAVVALRYGETAGATVQPAMGGLVLEGRL